MKVDQANRSRTQLRQVIVDCEAELAAICPAIEKCHFIEAMSTITPAAHRGATVYSRPLSLVV